MIDEAQAVLSLLKNFRIARVRAFTCSHDLLTLALHNGPDVDDFMRYEIRFIMCRFIQVEPVIHFEETTITVTDGVIDFRDGRNWISCREITVYDTNGGTKKICAIIP